MSMAECTPRVPDASRRLVLIRHAKSDYPAGVADHDRPLNRRGRREAPGVGDWLMAHVPVALPPLVIVSTSQRTRMTWSLIQGRLGGAWARATVVFESRVYEAEAPVLMDVVHKVPAEHRDVVIVGHAPGLPDLVISCARPGTLASQVHDGFPTSSVAVLETSRTWEAAFVDPLNLRSFAVVRHPRD